MDLFAAMQTFVRVVEAGSFTRAAETLGSSRTCVTQQVRLLNRTTRQVQTGWLTTNAAWGCWPRWTKPRRASRWPPARPVDGCGWTCPVRWRG